MAPLAQPLRLHRMAPAERASHSAALAVYYAARLLFAFIMGPILAGRSTTCATTSPVPDGILDALQSGSTCHGTHDSSTTSDTGEPMAVASARLDAWLAATRPPAATDSGREPRRGGPADTASLYLPVVNTFG